MVDNAEVRTASGMANLSIAVAPEDVRLEPPFNKLTVNVTAGTNIYPLPLKLNFLVNAEIKW